MAQQNKSNSLTEGSVARGMLLFAIPIFISNLFQQLYNAADSLIVGNFLGGEALAAVGSSGSLIFLLTGFVNGVALGAGVLIARYFGAKEYREMKTSVYTSLIGSAVLCAVLMGIGLFGCDALLELINTPEEILADSALYLDIYVLGLPFMFFYNIATGIFSAMGDSRTPFLFLMVSSLSNIGVDILCVAGFKMGIAGVAWATFLCQGVSCVLAMVVVFRRIRAFHTEGHVQLFSWNMLGKVAVVAVPSILQQSFISVGNIVIQGVINSFGSSVMAGYSASVKLNNLVITSLTTLGNGISNFTAQNIGASKMDRVRDGFRAGLKLVWMLCLPIVVLYLLGGRMLVNIFMNEPSEAAMASGVQFLRIVSPFYFLVSCKLVSDGVLRGAGLMKEFMVATFTDLILRVGLAIGLSKVLGVTGVWCAWPIGWTIAMVLSVLFYRRGPWEKQKA